MAPISLISSEQPLRKEFLLAVRSKVEPQKGSVSVNVKVGPQKGSVRDNLLGLWLVNTNQNQRQVSVCQDPPVIHYLMKNSRGQLPRQSHLVPGQSYLDQLKNLSLC